MKPDRSDSAISRRAVLTAAVTTAASLAMPRIALGAAEPYQDAHPPEKTTRKGTTLGGCHPLDAAVKAGNAKVKRLANVGLEHKHNIYLVKVISGTDPGTLYPPTNGSAYFKIRPNGLDTSPSRENGRSWDWYLLSCPHDPPCPLLAL